MRHHLSCVAVICLTLAGTATTQAAPLLVAGSLTYDSAADNGFTGDGVGGVNNSGMAVGHSSKHVSGGPTDLAAVRWDASGTAATELVGASANAVNAAGMAVGTLSMYGPSYQGNRAVRWNASRVVRVLGDLGTDWRGYTEAAAYAINDAGTAVGKSDKYVDGSWKGYRAVRWEASGTAATELGALGGTNSFGETGAYAYAINDAGTAVGYSQLWVSGGGLKGDRAVRWDASGTVATELGTLGAMSSGSADARAYAINDVGTAVGYSYKLVSGNNMGVRAVRWDGSGTAATELGTLGAMSSGSTYARAYAVNAAGTAVGRSSKYVSGNSKGDRAVRWDSSGTAATELGVLGTDASGATSSIAYAINDAGTTVGYSRKYVSGSNIGDRAVIWLPDASAIDLNDLGVAPVAGGGTWTLTSANALSADGYVAGAGTFDPDGIGPRASYSRLWVAQVGLGGTWTKATGGTWGRGPNWSTGTPAMQVGNATFDLDSAYTVSLDRDELTKTITLSKGTLTIDFAGHKLSTESGLTIAAGATLKGAGTIASNVQNAGTLAPGTSPGTLIIDGDLANTGTLQLEVADLLDHDHINVTGDFSAGGLIVLKLLAGYTPSAGDTFDLMNFSSFTNNAYAFDFSQAALPAGLWWDTIEFASTGGISVVPEPATLALLVAGLVSLAVVFVRRW